jgi:hypothetical protein
MNDPRNRGAATGTPTIGEGCLRRFDPDAVTSEQGADFTAAAELWKTWQTQSQADSPPAEPENSAADSTPDT